MTWMRGQAAQKLVELEESYKIDAFHSLGYGEEKQSCHHIFAHESFKKLLSFFSF